MKSRHRPVACFTPTRKLKHTVREGKSRMRGICGFDRGVASPESVSSVSKTAVGRGEDLAVEDGGVGAAVEVEEGVTNEEEEEVEELELGLTLGAANKGKAAPGTWGSSCRILTAKDFPSLTARASWRTPSATFVSASPDANLGGGTGVSGTKRAAESVAHEVGGSLHPPSQAVVGWPPIRAFRMNSLFNHSKDNTSETDASSALKKTNLDTGADSTCKVVNVSKDQENKGKARRSSFFVKVKMDGDPIGRKVDLSAHNSYETLAAALELMFRNPTMHLTLASSTHGTKTSKLFDGTCEFALTYEDKDGDWMLVGDVPWRMFLETVKRLRIMRTSEANGLSRPVHFGKHEGIYPLRKISGSIGSSPA